MASSSGRGATAYDRQQRIGTFGTNFIQQRGPRIDVQHWRAEITRALATEDRADSTFGVRLAEADAGGVPDRDGHRFYLTGVREHVLEMMRDLTARLPRQCSVDHRYEQPGATTAVARAGFRTSVLVTRDCQRALEARLRVRRWMRERCRTVDICLLLLCILAAATCLVLLNRHGEGYDQPWKNLLPPVQRLLGLGSSSSSSSKS
jgi:hypothetical protein